MAGAILPSRRLRPREYLKAPIQRERPGFRARSASHASERARRLYIAVDQLGASAPDPTCHFLQLTFPGVRIEWPDATGVAAYALHVLRGKTMKILVINHHRFFAPVGQTNPIPARLIPI
jgi:hypothetical protein